MRPNNPDIVGKFEIGLNEKTEGQRIATKDILDNLVFPMYQNAPTIAEITLTAEDSRVTDLVDSEVDASLDLLRCYTHFLYPRSARAFIGLRGSVTENTRPCIDLLDEGKAFHIQLDKVGLLLT